MLFNGALCTAGAVYKPFAFTIITCIDLYFALTIRKFSKAF
jgi:hypothetical protein